MGTDALVQLQLDHASLKAEVEGQGGRVDELHKKVDSLSEQVQGRDGLLVDMAEVKLMVKQMRWLLVVVGLVVLADYSPKLFDIVSLLFK